ncbi:MAG: serine hydrolase [Vicinamibacterales bacterium]
MRVRALTVVGIALVTGVTGCVLVPPATSEKDDVSAEWPTRSWRTSTPEAQGLDGAALAALDAEFAAGAHGYIDGMLVVRNGRIVYEKGYAHDYATLFQGRDPLRGPYNYYDPEWHPYHGGPDLHTMQSVSKSVTSALVGIAIGRKELPGVETKVLPLLGEFRPPKDAGWAAITLEHVLTMTTGIKWDESTVTYTDPANSCAGMEKSHDWVQFVLDQPLADAPGSKFVYNSGNTELLSYLIHHASGQPADEYANAHLFAPLGIEHYFWKRTPTGLADTEGGLYLAPRDLAKLGYLYLHDGVWDGRRVVPEGWVAASTRPLVGTSIGGARERRYGYQFWLLPHGDRTSERFAYAAIGYGGQLLIVVPEAQIVAVFTGWNIYDKPTLSPYLALDRVLGALRAS